jgi:hypothetical protein
VSPLASTVQAQQHLSLPLDGWYRTGRYMPVSVTSSDGSTSSTIVASGAVPTTFESTGNTAAIVPLLIFADGAGSLSVDNASVAGTPQLRPLASHQQLVAVAGGGDRLAAKLFPGESIVPVHLDPLDPLPGPALAWQTIDALILDGPWPGSFDVQKLPALLAGGTQIAVRSPERPDTLLPWESIDGGWVLRPLIAGPMGCDGNEDAYVPTVGWRPDLPGPVRVQIVLAALLFSLAAIGCMLLPRHFTVAGIVLATLFALVAVGVWQEKSPSVYRARGTVVVDLKPLPQTDRWEFITARQSAHAECDCAGETWPIFADTTQAQSQNLSLHWLGDGGRFSFDLPPNGKLAFVSRILQPQAAASAPSTTTQTDAPMADLARALYLHGRQHMTEEPGSPWNVSDAAPVWPTVHVSPDYSK